MASYFIKRFPPKNLYIFGTLSAAFCMVIIGAFIFLQTNYPLSHYLDTFSWVPLASAVIAIGTRSIGIMPVMQSLMSEVFPTDIRTESIGLVTAVSVSSGAICMKFFPDMKNLLTLHGLFFSMEHQALSIAYGDSKQYQITEEKV